jgi:hypothetical protein
VDNLGAKIVKDSWLIDSGKEKRRLDERLYYCLKKHYEEDVDESEADDESEEEDSDSETAPASPSPPSSSSSASTSSQKTPLTTIFNQVSVYFHASKETNDFKEITKV